jgi:hypothetical protein
VLYAGHVYAGGAGIMDALAALLALDPSLPRRVLFRFVGSLDAPAAERARPLQAAGLVACEPPVPVQAVPALLTRADALLYCVPPAGRHWITSKLYDDLVARRPVLAVLPRGDAWDVLARAGVGTLIEDLGPARVAHELRDALARLLDGHAGHAPRRGLHRALLARADGAAGRPAAQLAGRAAPVELELVPPAGGRRSRAPEAVAGADPVAEALVARLVRAHDRRAGRWSTRRACCTTR